MTDPLGPATRPSARISSIPAPAVSGAMLFCRAVSWSTSASMTGHTWSQTWFMSRRAPLAPRPARARRIASRQLAMARSTCGSEVTRPASSRTTPSWRTWASAMSRWSAGFSLATAK